MTKWYKKALAVAAIGVAAGIVVPGTASAATKHSTSTVSASSILVTPKAGSQVAATPLVLGWEPA